MEFFGKQMEDATKKISILEKAVLTIKTENKSLRNKNDELATKEDGT